MTDPARGRGASLEGFAVRVARVRGLALGARGRARARGVHAGVRASDDAIEGVEDDADVVAGTFRNLARASRRAKTRMATIR